MSQAANAYALMGQPSLSSNWGDSITVTIGETETSYTALIKTDDAEEETTGSGQRVKRVREVWLKSADVSAAIPTTAVVTVEGVKYAVIGTGGSLSAGPWYVLKLRRAGRKRRTRPGFREHDPQ